MSAHLALRNSQRQWDVLRAAAFFIILLFIYIEPNPTSNSWTDQGAAGQVDGQFFQQALWPGLFLLTLLVLRTRLPDVMKQIDFYLLATFAWFFLSTIYAVAPDVSFRRFLFLIFAMLSIVVALSSIEDENLVIKVYKLVFTVSILYAYFYVIVTPASGIHQASGPEPQLAGDWRGQFAHKSLSGIVFALMAMTSIRFRFGPWYRLFIIPLLLLFVLKSGDKTVAYLFIPIFLLVNVVISLRSRMLIILVVAGPLLLINYVTLGSLYDPSLSQVASKIIGDSSFTGRTELWRLLIYYSGIHPYLGSGYQSFWQLNTESPAQIYGGTWLKNAFYGHQGYLDTMATVGVPGFLLALSFIAWRPIMDVAKLRNRRDPFLAAYVSMWLFPLYQSVTESNLFEKANPSWIFMLMGIVGLRRLVLKEASIEPEAQPFPYATDRRLKPISASEGYAARAGHDSPQGHGLRAGQL